MPIIGPIATNTTASEAGKKIPKPRSPTTCLAAAITAAIKGKRRRSTIVFGGTPASTAPRIAYLIGLKGNTGPKTCSRKSISKGSTVSSVSWVKSGLGVGVDSGVGATSASLVAAALSVDSRLCGLGETTL